MKFEELLCAYRYAISAACAYNSEENQRQREETRTALVEYVAGLEAEVKQMRSLVDGSAGEILSEVLENNGSPDEIKAKFLAHPIFGLFALQMADWFVDAGGKNYVDVIIGLTAETTDFIMTIQKRTGKTAHELKLEAEAENARLQDRLAACEASLVGMVQQYCGYWDDINPDATYHHDFVSAGENAFAYLLEHNLATLAENGVDIRFPEVK